MAARLNERDFAIVIGISRYSHDGYFRDLRGSEADADAVFNWLTDPSGGALPANNVIVLHSPTRSEAEHAFDQMFDRFINDPGRRLYIYGSGHGFSDGPDGAALLMADASRRRSSSICLLYTSPSPRDS